MTGSAPNGEPTPVPNTRAGGLTADELVLRYREYVAQLRDALGTMISEFGAGAGWRTEKQEAALKKALPVFLFRQEPVVERDATAELVQENTELRRILSECASAAGGAAAPTCSLEFFAALPREIELVRHKDTAELVEALEFIVRVRSTEREAIEVARAALAKWKAGNP